VYAPLYLICRHVEGDRSVAAAYCLGGATCLVAFEEPSVLQQLRVLHSCQVWRWEEAMTAWYGVQDSSGRTAQDLLLLLQQQQQQEDEEEPKNEEEGQVHELEEAGDEEDKPGQENEEGAGKEEGRQREVDGWRRASLQQLQHLFTLFRYLPLASRR
jgi:hypothetical protein